MVFSVSVTLRPSVNDLSITRGCNGQAQLVYRYYFTAIVALGDAQANEIIAGFLFRSAKTCYP